MSISYPGVPVGDVHGFVKQVVSSNKTEVLRHLLQNGFSNIRLQDLIYLSCQHGCLEMTKLIMDSKQVNIFSQSSWYSHVHTECVGELRDQVRVDRRGDCLHQRALRRGQDVDHRVRREGGHQPSQQKLSELPPGQCDRGRTFSNCQVRRINSSLII